MKSQRPFQGLAARSRSQPHFVAALFADVAGAALHSRRVCCFRLGLKENVFSRLRQIFNEIAEGVFQLLSVLS